MRIDARPYGALGAVSPPPGKPAAGGAFKVGESRTGRPGAARSSAPLATLDAILTLQAEEDPRERRRRSARRGQDILDDLDRLKAALVTGRLAPGTLRAIADRLAAATGPTGDPALDDTLAAIELRARVELAKLGC